MRDHLKVIHVTAALRRRIAHVEEADALFPNAAEGSLPLEIAKVALADELLCMVKEQHAARLARLPARARSLARVVHLSTGKRARRRAG
jgi:hypothetical protein